MKNALPRLSLAVTLGLAFIAAQAAAPAVDDKAGITYVRGKIFGWDSDTDFARTADFHRLTAEGASTVEGIAIDRIYKFDGDADRYAFWLATNHSYASLVEAFKAASPGVDATVLRAPAATAFADLCSPAADRLIRQGKDGIDMSQRWYCEGAEQAFRQSLPKSANGIAQLGMLLSQATAASLASTSTVNHRISVDNTGGVFVQFLQGKRNIGVAYLVLAQAAHEAQTGTKNQAISYATKQTIGPHLQISVVASADQAFEAQRFNADAILADIPRFLWKNPRDNRLFEGRRGLNAADVYALTESVFPATKADMERAFRDRLAEQTAGRR